MFGRTSVWGERMFGLLFWFGIEVVCFGIESKCLVERVFGVCVVGSLCLWWWNDGDSGFDWEG